MDCIEIQGLTFGTREKGDPEKRAEKAHQHNRPSDADLSFQITNPLADRRYRLRISANRVKGLFPQHGIGTGRPECGQPA